MTRQEIHSSCLKELQDNKNLLIELPTGFGKTKEAINLLNYLAVQQSHPLEVLLLIAKRVHRQNWQDEFAKWHLNPNVQVTIECYNSFRKYKDTAWDVLLLDECHHIQSNMRLELLGKVTFRYLIGLSATIPRELRIFLKTRYHVGIVHASLQDAISDNVLPEPRIVLFPLTLDDKKKSETIEVNPTARNKRIIDDISHAWKYKNNKKRATLMATQWEKLKWLNNEVLLFKRRFEATNHPGIRLRWLRACGERLKYLAYCKNDIMLELLDSLKDCRTLTFCYSIEQAELLGRQHIHSKNKASQKILDAFNTGAINHITSCQMLNEGMNLHDCQYGIFANINASHGINVQRMGRLLRHEHPVIIFPYYVHSREEEIVHDIVESYDKKLISQITNTKEL